MNDFKTLTVDEAVRLSFEQLISDYNDAVETIYDLRTRLREEMELCDWFAEGYEELSSIYYG